MDEFFDAESLTPPPEDMVEDALGSGDSPDSSETEELQFDITLAATHSYMGAGLECVPGRTVPEAGWLGTVPARAHRGVLFPGQTVPVLLHRDSEIMAMQKAIHGDRLFALICPDDTGQFVSGYGVLCEVFEAGHQGDMLSVKARATHRVRLRELPQPCPIHRYNSIQPTGVEVLPERAPRDALRHVRLAGPRSSRGGSASRMLDAALTPWPHFVLDLADFDRLRAELEAYLKALDIAAAACCEPVSFSFWCSTNLPLPGQLLQRHLAGGCATERLLTAVRTLRESAPELHCATCGAGPLCGVAELLAMSSTGLVGSYANPGGYTHDVVTVSKCAGVRESGAPSAQFSWFPGYSWTVCVCAHCGTHVGWRFRALKRALRPNCFYGLARAAIAPRTLSRTVAD